MNARRATAEGGRRAARRSAMMLLYQLDVLDVTAQTAIDQWEHEQSSSFPPYARTAVSGVLAMAEQLDAQIAGNLHEWSLDRIGAVERSIMRLALWEMRSQSVPPEVAIDEAVELAKRYSSPEAAKLVNGVLGTIVRRGEHEGPDER